MEIIPFREEFLPAAAELFVKVYQRQRAAVPALPGEMADPAEVVNRLRDFFSYATGLAALEEGRLAGYMGWWVVDDFRETGRKGTYIPVWGHGEAEESRHAVRLALYRAAAVMWTEAGCKTHGAGYLPVDEGAERFWFWNGFGLTGVDAIRPMQPIEVACPAGLAVRKARVDDAPAVALLESEHMRHYSAPPVWMTVRHPVIAEGYAEFLSSPQNAVYLAEAGGEPVGYIRFEAKSSGATEIVQSEGTVAISAGYTRARRRGQGTAGAILDAALQDYAAAGYERCSVDFESFNPQASAFWLRYFEPVCLSALRYPESMLG